LIVLLESGPLASLARAGALLTQTSSGQNLSARVSDAQCVLTDVLRGLHPVEADGGLVDAIAKLADRSHATFVIDPEVDPATGLGTTEQEVVWFTCAEGLANATKHAPGSAVAVRLQTSPVGYVLTVSDDGPGGADAAGSGLSGLRERAGAVSGNLTVESTQDGTTLRLLVPAREGIACCHVAGAVSAPIRTPIEFGTVGA
jgi:signal transduction histidine kinase